MSGKVAAVARNTFTETIRQPIFVVLLLGAMLLLILNPALCAYAFDDDNKLLTDLGLSTIFVAGLLLAAFSATGVFCREIENQTVLTVISKPIGRPAFVLGKYLGVTAAILVAFGVWSLVFLLSVRHGVLTRAGDPYDWPVLVFGITALGVALAVAIFGNFFYRWVFASALSGLLAPLLALAYVLVLGVGKDWRPQALTTDLDGQLLTALLLIGEALALLCAVALAASTRLGQVMTLLVCSAVFLVGLSSDYLFGRFAQTNFGAALAYAVVPNLQYHWLADALTQQHPVNAAYVGLVSAYSALYIVGVLALSMALFQTREVG